MAAVEQRLCSGGNGGRGVLGLGAAIAWGMGLLVRRGWLKRQSRRSRRDGCGRCAERMAREEGDSDMRASTGLRGMRAQRAG